MDAGLRHWSGVLDMESLKGMDYTRKLIHISNFLYQEEIMLQVEEVLEPQIQKSTYLNHHKV